MDQMLEFSDEDFKATIIKMFQQSLTNSLATDEKKNLSKEINVIKENQIEIIELKNTVTEFLKNHLLYRLSRVVMTEVRISELEDKNNRINPNLKTEK